MGDNTMKNGRFALTAVAALGLAACDKGPVTLDPVPYAPLAPGTVINWTDTATGTDPTYSAMVLAVRPTHALYVTRDFEDAKPVFYVEYYGLRYVSCGEDDLPPEADIRALASLWPMRQGLRAELSDGRIYSVGDAARMKLPIGERLGFNVMEHLPDGLDGNPITSTLRFLPQYAAIGQWTYDGGADYLLSINEPKTAPPKALVDQGLDACGVD